MQITQEVQKMQLVFGGSLEACTLTRILSCTVQLPYCTVRVRCIIQTITKIERGRKLLAVECSTCVRATCRNLSNSLHSLPALISQYHFSTSTCFIQYHLLHLVSSFQKHQVHIRAFVLSVLCCNV